MPSIIDDEGCGFWIFDAVDIMQSIDRCMAVKYEKMCPTKSIDPESTHQNSREIDTWKGKCANGEAITDDPPTP